MNRQAERVLQRLVNASACVLLLGALVLLARMYLLSAPPSNLDTGFEPKFALSPEKTAQTDGRVAKLSNVRMSRPIATPSATKAKAAPPLETLIRVKGVFAYGDPKDNEALIEVIRSNQTKGYRVGETIPEVNATVVKIDSSVTFQYDGKTLKLEIQNNQRADAGPIAAPNGPNDLANVKR
jgi:hypothetical protein